MQTRVFAHPARQSALLVVVSTGVHLLRSRTTGKVSEVLLSVRSVSMLPQFSTHIWRDGLSLGNVCALHAVCGRDQESLEWSLMSLRRRNLQPRLLHTASANLTKIWHYTNGVLWFSALDEICSNKAISAERLQTQNAIDDCFESTSTSALHSKRIAARCAFVPYL